MADLEPAKLTKMQTFMAENSVKPQNENNPIMAHKFGADPAVLVYNDTVYIYATNDMQQVESNEGKEDNRYNKITSLTLFSSKDLVNWTDLGVIHVAGSNGGKGDAKWANNSWAPAIACKKINGKDKFFLYFADSGNGIGVVTADSPEGPFVDPIKKALISRDVPTCREINWLFDPAVIVDDDGKGYLYFGGGHDPEKYEHPKTARCVALGDDMISIVGTPQVIDAPFLFEDSGIHKMGKTYYYTYCSNFADRAPSCDKDKMPAGVICYMTSENPLGPFEYKGYTLENPGTYFGPGGNNHHWIFNFKNKWYIAYHTQTLEKTVNLEKGGYRAVFLTEFAVNADGSFPIQNATREGIEQVGTFSPYGKIPAATFHSSRYVAVSASQTIVAVKDGAYVCIKGVNFAGGASSIELNCVPGAKKGCVKVCIDSAENGTVLGEASLEKASAEGKLNAVSGIHDLFLVLGEGTELVDWKIK